MAVDPDFHAISSSPSDGLLEVGICTLDVGRIGVIIGPESDGDAECIDPRCGDGFDVGFCEEG